ncbi:hypothetical protein DFH09DRAFT_1270741, partial [Mycena vulgaris]
MVCGSLWTPRVFNSQDRGITVSLLRLDPNSHCICDKSLTAIFATWRKVCGRHHEHEGVSGSSLVSQSSSPTYLAGPSTFDSSPCSSLTYSFRSLLGPHPDLPPLTTAQLPQKKPLRTPPSSLTTTRSPPPSRAMSPRLETSFSPVKGSSNLKFPTPVHTSTPTLPAFPPPPAASPASPALPAPPQYTMPATPASSSLIVEGGDRPRLFYAVSACNRLLVSQSRAFELFMAMDGAVMMLTSSLEDATVFFERTPGLQTTYAVSGERKIFRD